MRLAETEEIRVFEVRIRLARGEGEDGQQYNYVRLTGEETERPDKIIGKDEVGRRWIKVPTLTWEGQADPGIVFSVQNRSAGPQPVRTQPRCVPLVGAGPARPQPVRTRPYASTR